MKARFDPERHHRRSIRLPGYDYRRAGAYFVTICTHERELLFEHEALRRQAEARWKRIPYHFPHVELDAWVVMPNHLHGILLFTEDEGRGEASLEITSPPSPVTPNSIRSSSEPTAGDASPLRRRAPGLVPGSLGAVVGNFKSVTARRINRLRGTPGAPVWQRNYYEHVIRDERALNAIRQYTADNPARWALDRYNPEATGRDSQAVDLWRMLRER